jgi:hypothetical protein
MIMPRKVKVVNISDVAEAIVENEKQKTNQTKIPNQKRW